MKHDFRKLYLLLIFTTFFFGGLFAQTVKIEGKIISNEEEPIYNASVSAVDLRNELVISYAITDSLGNYNLLISPTYDSVKLIVKHIGFRAVSQNARVENKQIDFSLEPSILQLEDIEIKANSLISDSNDTVTYHIDAVKSQNDRVLADILKKLPGIEIESDGRILYQGKPIQKYYIEGLDLLGGRYSLANNNMPTDAVESVQILENHQPIRMLDSLVFSDKASINIKLKDGVSVIGQAKLGAGFSPMLWDVNLTPMLFSKRRQFLATYQTNNIGENIGRQLNRFSIEELSKSQYSKSRKWLNIQPFSPPPFSDRMWLDNRSHLYSLNYLSRIKENIDVRFNANYLNEKIDKEGNAVTVFYTPSDTIRINEIKENNEDTRTLQGELKLEKNTSKKYLLNSLEFEKQWINQTQQLNNSGSFITQIQASPMTSISNDFNYLFPVDKKIINIKSFFSYLNNDQELRVEPGPFDDFLNNGDNYEFASQKLNHEVLYSMGSVNSIYNFNKLLVKPEVGYSFHKQQLSSDLIRSPESQNFQTSDLKNNLVYTYAQAYMQLGLEYKHDYWVFKLTTPLKFTRLDAADKTVERELELERVTFEPKLSISNRLSDKWSIGLSLGRSNNFGNIEQQYMGYILRGYRSLQRNSSDFQERLNHNIGASIDFKEPLKAFFASLNYYSSFTANNLVFSQIIGNQGETELISIDLDNNSSSHNLNLNLSKFISQLNSTLSFKVALSRIESQQIIGGNFADIGNDNIILNPSLYIDLASWAVTEYESTFSRLTNSVNNENQARVWQQMHKLRLIFFIGNAQFLEMSGEYFKNDFAGNRDNYLLNLGYTYPISKKRIDLKFSWTNILNAGSFTSVYNNEFSYYSNTYILRPSQVVFHINFGIN